MSKLNVTGIQDSKPTHCMLFHFAQVASLLELILHEMYNGLNEI
jgi:hypothetical protein